MKVDVWSQVVVGEVNSLYKPIHQIGRNMSSGLPPSKPKVKLKLNYSIFDSKIIPQIGV
jgi:hypothetical protein